MIWSIKTFEELSTQELYAILKARCEVFVVEQNCPYQDPDGLDDRSVHIVGWENGEIAAYCRITPKGTRFAEDSIGRVITTAGYRSGGHGRTLMEKAIRYVTGEMGGTAIRISGQAYLRRFYESLGFRVVSDEYLEDDIPHVEMLYTVEST